MMGLFSKDKNSDLTADERNSFEEQISDLQQAVSEANDKVAKMTIARTPEGMMKMAEEAANQIEEAFAVGGMSRAQRFLNIAAAIRRQITIACGGEAIWSD